ncbi:MAG: hypothetical protein Q4A62_02945 [Eikenella sp.]|nr:hypothetical protein [Eikenella sp.]
MKKLALVSVLAVLSAPVWAADSYLSSAQEVNRNTVKEADAQAREIRLHNLNLKAGETGRTTLNLEAGKTYTVFGDCDTDCSNIDMTVSLNGTEVKSERGSSDAPVFSWVADKSGAYQVEVLMKDCSDARCRAHVQAFEGTKVVSGGGSRGGDWLQEAQKINRDKILEADSTAVERPIATRSLAEDEKHSETVQLTAGKYYAFFADCDTDCSDIDLTLTRGSETIRSLTDPGDAPEFVWRATQSGDYKLTVSMEDCDADKCSYSTQIFESDKDLDTSLVNAHKQNREVVQQKDSGARELLLRETRLRQGQTLTVPLNLRAGKVYTFYGDCDNACSDIDLTLSRNGRAVKSDVLPDSVPLFSWRANRSGAYTVTIPMKTCSAEDCAVSAHIFEGSKMVYE